MNKWNGGERLYNNVQKEHMLEINSEKATSWTDKQKIHRTSVLDNSHNIIVNTRILWHCY